MSLDYSIIPRVTNSLSLQAPTARFTIFHPLFTRAPTRLFLVTPMLQTSKCRIRFGVLSPIVDYTVYRTSLPLSWVAVHTTISTLSLPTFDHEKKAVFCQTVSTSSTFGVSSLLSSYFTRPAGISAKHRPGQPFCSSPVPLN